MDEIKNHTPPYLIFKETRLFRNGNFIIKRQRTGRAQYSRASTRKVVSFRQAC